MHSPRTRKYIEAMNSEGEKFDYWRWFQRVQEDEAQAKSAAGNLASGRSTTPEIRTLVNTPNGSVALEKFGSATHPKNDAGSKSPISIEQQRQK